VARENTENLASLKTKEDLANPMIPVPDYHAKQEWSGMIHAPPEPSAVPEFLRFSTQ
jgi:hypothetical protein